MVDKGLLSYEEKVCKYWPEFAKHGKEQITLADVLRHESGLNNLDHTAKIVDFSRENIRKNVLGKPVEDCTPKWPLIEKGAGNFDGSDTKRHYHALARGWILNEIIRRVDPGRRTLGEILQEDVPVDDIFCGLSDSQLGQTATLSTKSLWWLAMQSITPKGGLNIIMNHLELHLSDFS